MKLSEITLGWGIAFTALLVAVATLIAWLCTRNRRGVNTATKDSSESWERTDEHRRRKEAVYGAASYTLLFCCAAVAAALSFHGLVGFGRQNLNLSGGWEYLVPFGLDGAAMFCSVLAVREASHGDAALGSRLLVWTFASAAAWFNWVHAPRGDFHAGAPHFFAGMSLSAAVLFDRALKQTRRAALREQGLVPRPLPQIRVVRWMRAPRETFRAWSLMLLEGVRSLDEAVDEVREDKRQAEANRERKREATRRERVQLRALNRQNRLWSRGGRQVGVAMLGAGSGAGAGAAAAEEGDRLSREPAIGESRTAAGAAAAASEPAAKSLSGAGLDAASAPAPVGRPLLRTLLGGGEGEHARARSGTGGGPAAVRPEDRPIDLTAEDDTLTLPRLDSLERKLKDLEQQFN